MNNFQIKEKILDVDGFSLAYTDIGPKDGRIVFCVHGLLSNGRVFDFLGIELAKHGYRVIAVDLPGRGRSEYFKDYTNYHVPNYIPYCRALIDHVTKGKGYDWLGVSLGGTLGMTMHNADGLNMERYITVDIGPEVPSDVLYKVEELSKALFVYETKDEAAAVLKSRCGEWGIEDNRIWDHLIKHSIIKRDDGMFCSKRDDGVGRAFNVQDDAVHMWDSWEKIKQPTLLIRGGLSTLLPEDIAQEMHARYKGEQFDEIVYDKCGHVPNLMQEDHIEAVAQWLGKK